MDPQEVDNNTPKPSGHGKIFAVAIILGALLGAMATLLVFNMLKMRNPIVVQVENKDTLSKTNGNDTIVKYVVHKYEKSSVLQDDQLPPEELQMADSLMTDDLSEDLTMDDAAYVLDGGGVAAPKVLSRSSVKVTYLDNDRNEISPLESFPTTIQVEFLETPIRNKVSYHFSDNVLKLKGLPVSNVRVYHYKNCFYVTHNHRVFQVNANSQFDKLVEVHNVSF